MAIEDALVLATLLGEHWDKPDGHVEAFYLYEVSFCSVGGLVCFFVSSHSARPSTASPPLEAPVTVGFLLPTPFLTDCFLGLEGKQVGCVHGALCV